MAMATDHHHDSYNRVPVGLRFRPTQQELIYLLQLKSQRVDISTLTASVLEKNLYGDEEDKEPWRVFSDIDDQHWEAYDDFGKSDTKKRVLYVITKLSKMGAKKTSRTAGRGTWDGQTKPKPVKNYGGDDDDQDIGFMKSLIYTTDPGFESEAEANSYYYMHEYSLCDFSLRQAGIASTDYVICRIVKDDSKRCNVGKRIKKAKNNVIREEKEPAATLKIHHGQEHWRI